MTRLLANVAHLDEMDAYLDQLIADLPPITDEQRRLAVSLLFARDHARAKADPLRHNGLALDPRQDEFVKLAS